MPRNTPSSVSAQDGLKEYPRTGKQDRIDLYQDTLESCAPPRQLGAWKCVYPTSVPALAEKAIKASKKKPVTLVREPVVMADGSEFVPMAVNNSSDLLRASLLTLFKHVADIHITVVEVIADKFGLSIDEIHTAITEDPRWKKMLVDPVISDLTQSAKEQSKPAKTAIKVSSEEELIFD